MARAPARKFDEKQLTKGELRKLNALRKSLGDEIAEKAFGEWYAKHASNDSAQQDKNAQQIAEALQPLIEKKKLQIPRSGYILKRGRGRVIVEQPES
jgi:hypothetical protein